MRFLLRLLHQEPAPAAEHAFVSAGLDAEFHRTARQAQRVYRAPNFQNGAPVDGATVSGVLSDGATGGASCTTDASGACTVEKGNLKSSVPSVTFTVTGISKEGYVYDPSGSLGGVANVLDSVTVDQ